MEELLKKILDSKVITFLEKSETGYLLGTMDKKNYMKPDSHQTHFTGKELNEVLEKAAVSS